jgi:hypothetical protein
LTQPAITGDEHGFSLGYLGEIREPKRERTISITLTWNLWKLFGSVIRQSIVHVQWSSHAVWFKAAEPRSLASRGTP